MESFVAYVALAARRLTLGVQEFFGTGIDVTEHELLTQELGRREPPGEAQRLSHTGSFGWKPDTGEIIWQPKPIASSSMTERSRQHRLIGTAYSSEDRADFPVSH